MMRGVSAPTMGWKFYRKGIYFWLAFMALYFAFKLAPVFPLTLICATNESVFQHFKAGFFAYGIVSLIEYATQRRRIIEWSRFVVARIAATTFLPWLFFVLWYIAPAIYDRWNNVVLEIVYANIITIVAGIGIAALERDWAQIEFSIPARCLLIVLFSVSIGLYLIFTFKLPWADVFVEPNWR